MTMLSVSLSPLLSIISFTFIQVGHGELVLLQSIFRHGDRSPTGLYPNDPNPPDVWREGFGKLTQLGRLQHYTVGKQIRSLYSDFITSSPNEVVVNSTDIDRCRRSAESHLAGLYAPSKEWQFTPDLIWQPIPIHYINLDVDKYLNPVTSCPRAEAEASQIFHSPEFKAFYEDNKPMLRNLSICSGQKLNLTSAEFLQNILEIEMEYNLEIPPCMLPYYDQLVKFANAVHFYIYRSPLIQKLRAGPLLGKMIERMQQKIAGQLPQLKVQIYSARDRNVAAVLQAVDAYNMHHPPYATTLLFELHQLEAGPAVRLLMFNSTRPQDGDQSPLVLTLTDCGGEFCPLEHFIKRTLPLVPEDFGEECQLGSSED